ncbi:MAG: transposase [Phycisphaerae bacterium]|jgi:REP element-mobilizing transposase RayT
MGKLIGYMVTWTTYGTWLQGDKRGYVKNGKILEPDPELEKANQRQQSFDKVTLTSLQREIIKSVILSEAKQIGQKIFAIAVCSNHVHILVEAINKTPSYITGRYKRAGTIAMLRAGFKGKLWTQGFDKRYCFDEDSLQKRIQYIEKHNIQPI